MLLAEGNPDAAPKNFLNFCMDLIPVHAGHTAMRVWVDNQGNVRRPALAAHLRAGTLQQ
jgi:hypothetical protein